MLLFQLPREMKAQLIKLKQWYWAVLIPLWAVVHSRRREGRLRLRDGDEDEDGCCPVPQHQVMESWNGLEKYQKYDLIPPLCQLPIDQVAPVFHSFVLDWFGDFVLLLYFFVVIFLFYILFYFWFEAENLRWWKKKKPKNQPKTLSVPNLIILPGSANCWGACLCITSFWCASPHSESNSRLQDPKICDRQLWRQGRLFYR